MAIMLMEVEIRNDNAENVKNVNRNRNMEKEKRKQCFALRTSCCNRSMFWLRRDTASQNVAPVSRIFC